MGGVPYSPELVLHLNMINLWRLLIRKKKGSCSNMRTIIRLQKRCGVVGRPLDLDITEMYQQLKERIMLYRIFKKTAATSRATFQDYRIEELALAGEGEAFAIRLKIKNLEAC